MAKTYTAAGSAVAGDVYTAAAHNVIVTDVNNLIVPPALRLNLTADATITNGSLISWSSAAYNTDGMWSSGSTITVQTSGIYLMTFAGFVSTTGSLTYAIAQYGVSSDLGYYGNAGQVLGGTGAYVSHSMVSALTAGDTINFAVAVAGSGTYTLRGTANDQTRARATVTWIGRTS